WQKPYERDFSKTDHRVPILSGAPRDEAWKHAADFELGGATLEVIAHPNVLRVRGEMDEDQGGTLELFAGPDAKGRHAKMSFEKDPEPVVNEAGRRLWAGYKISFGGDVKKGRKRFHLDLPYTSAPGQTAAWANGIEHGRLSLRFGKGVANL